MPELPEVQTIINALKKKPLLNHNIIKVDILLPKVIKNTTPTKFKSFMLNESIVDIKRKGKYLIFCLSHNKVWLVHLRMEGKLFFHKTSEQLHQSHLMVQLDFDNGYTLGYYDTRMFGTFHVFNSLQDAYNSKELLKVAIDPFDKEFTKQYLYDRIHNIKRAIKTTLLDQSIVSGIGNIYADEILFMCKINPLRPANKVSLADCANIVKYSRSIMDASMKHKGTTVFSYKFEQDHSGEFQKFLKAHTKEGEKCPKCGTKIVKIKVKGRGTYYCPSCQSK